MNEQTREEKNRVKEEYWITHIEAWRKSGLSQIDYCRGNNLSSHRFTYWKCKGDKQSKPLTFTPVLHKPSKITWVLKGAEKCEPLITVSGL